MQNDTARLADTSPLPLTAENSPEVQDFADRHSIPVERAVEILKAADGDRAAADEAARNLTARI